MKIRYGDGYIKRNPEAVDKKEDYEDRLEKEKDNYGPPPG